MLAAAILSVALLLPVAEPVPRDPDRTQLEPARALADARLTRRAIEAIHPGADRYADPAILKAAFDRFEAACASGCSEREFFLALSEFLAHIRCSHTKAEPAPAWSAWRDQHPAYLPFRFAADAGGMIITDSATPLLVRGTRVLAINNEPVQQLLADVFALVPADGWTDDARWFAVGGISDLDDCEFDLFLPYLRRLDDTVTLEVLPPDSGVASVVTVPRMTRAARAAGLARPPAARNLDEATSLTFLDNDTALLTVGTFVAYRKKIDPEDVYRPLFEQVRARGTRTLILDLRDNGGGSDEAAIDLASFLIDAPFDIAARRPWVRTFTFGDLRPFLSTWDESVFSMPADLFTPLPNGFFELRTEPQRIEPLEPRFSGRLIALCGPANASGATLFLAGLRERRPVTLVGAPTGGSVEGPTAGTILFLKLPETGAVVRIPALRSFTGFTPPAPGRGLVPDIDVRPSPEDLVRGRDPVLERARELTRAPAPSP